MDKPVPSARIFRFGLFEADVARMSLTRSGVRVKIQDQPFRVLVLLLEHSGELVTREELKQKLWPEGTYVDFDGSLNVILKKLRAAIDDDSDNPRFIETVPRRGYRFIAPVSYVAKFGDGSAIAQKEAPKPVPDTPSTDFGSSGEVPSIVRTRNRHFGARLAPLVLIVVTLIAWVVFRGTPPSAESVPRQTSTTVPMRRSIAVLGFHNVSGNAEDAWLGTALSEMLSTELAGGEQLRLVSGEDVANLRITSPWSQTDSLDQATTSRIGTALSSNLLVLGSFTTIHAMKRAQLRLDVCMQDARTGDIIAEFAETGETEDLFRLVFNIGSRLRTRLGVPEVQEVDQAGVLAALPLNADAARFYAMGLVKLRQFDALSAKDLLLQATAADPKFCLGHAMLARAWGQLGYDQKRKAEAKRALDLSADLSRADKMLVEGEYYDSVGDHEQAATVYDALFQLFPDNLDYGLRYVTAQIKAGNSKKALSVIGLLRALPPPLSADPRIDLTESDAIKVNKPASLALVRSAVRKAATQGKTPIYAMARRHECLALLYSDQPEGTISACEDAYNVFLSVGNRAGAADAVRLMGDRLGSEGRYADAIATYERALSLLSGLGEHGKTGAILNNMAINFANEGKLDLAQKYYQEAKADFEEVGEKINSATANTNIADILYMRGNLPAAESEYRKSLELLATADHAENGYELYRLADLELTRGNINHAKNHAQEAVESYRSVEGSFQYLTGAMVVLGKVLESQGDFIGARMQFAHALEIRRKMGEADLAAESEVELANLSMEEGHPEQAVPLLQKTVGIFESETAAPDASNAYIRLSRALLLTGKTDEASIAIEQALKIRYTNSDPSLRLLASIQKMRIEGVATSGKTRTAVLQNLRAVSAEARRLGYFNIECEARFAMAQLELRSNSPAAILQFSTLSADARSRGFTAVAVKAEKALAETGNVMADNKSPR